jgi:hypothetical protein
MTSSADAARFLAEMYQFAERLAGRGLVVRSLRSDWGSFGSWMIEASAGDAEDRREAAIRSGEYEAAGPDVVRVSWDGKDGVLEAGLLHTTGISSGSRAVPLLSQAAESSSEALRIAENLLVDRLAE